MRARFVLCAAVLVALLSGCLERAALPPIRQGVDAQSKQRIYEDFKLTYDRGPFSEAWVRRDGAYNLPELENVVEAYPETRVMKHDILTRRFVIGTVGGVGAGIIGGTLGYNLSAGEAHQMSSSTQTTLYVSGASLVLAAIVMQVAWRDPAEDLADTYNRALATDLGLAPGSAPTPGGPPPVYRASRLEPRFVVTPAPIVTPSGALAPGVGGALVF